MSSKQIVVVTGATGVQGGSVVRFLLEDGYFAVRAVTRNPESDVAKELAARGAEVIKADSRDSASILRAFQGAYGVFGLTNYWETGVGGDGERTQGKILIDAAKSCGIKHFVWSTLDHTEFKADHWESKADVDDYLKSSGLPRTSLYTTFYFENFLGMTGLSKRPDGTLEFPLPLTTDTPFAVYSAADTGAWALVAFKHPEQWIGKDMRITAEFLSLRNMTKEISTASKKVVHVQEISPALFETFRDNPIPEDFHANMQILFKYNEAPFRDPELARQLYPEMKTFRTWLEENVAKIVA